MSRNAVISETTTRELLTEDAIREHLSTARYGRRIFAFDRAGSTNDIAIEYAKNAESDPDGTLVVAEYQTRGRGRFDRRWFAPPYSCLLFSLVVCPEPRLPRPSLLTLAMGLALVEAAQSVTATRCGLKWPNDLHLNDRKLGGILTESGVRPDRRRFWVVGVGVNVNVPLEGFDSDTETTSTSLLIETSQPTSRARLLAAILATYESWTRRLLDGDLDGLLDRARTLTTTLGRTVIVRRAGAELTGVAFDLDDDGALLVRTAMGRVLTVMTNDDFVIDAPSIRERNA